MSTIDILKQGALLRERLQKKHVRASNTSTVADTSFSSSVLTRSSSVFPQSTSQRTSSRGSKNSLSAKNTGEMIDALVVLGYPIGRYLRAIAANDDYARGLPKIFARMRKAYHQNRAEFTRLQKLLRDRLFDVETSELLTMVEHAQDFAPMWVTRVRAEAILNNLRASE
jgi:hypothetical protein